MKYHQNALDAKLQAWFTSDLTRALLRSIKLEKGVFRGLNSLNLTFVYPITAICGKNGAGKSTVTALACCAYHNEANGYKLPKRRNPYYTFSDFFIQHTTDAPLSDIAIRYGIAHDNWTPSARLPDGKGVGMQVRAKKKGGKWVSAQLTTSFPPAR